MLYRALSLMLAFAIALNIAMPTDKGFAAERPDIVFIISDDQAWSDYSFMGHRAIQTPNLDRLARESLVFTRGYVPDSLCRPSLATIISGLYPHQHGIVGNDPPTNSLSKLARQSPYNSPEYHVIMEEFWRLHIDRLNTIPKRIKPLGYVSFQTGKWWEGNPCRAGFDQSMTHGDPNRGGRHGDAGLEIGRPNMEPAVEFIKQARSTDQPYFLWFAPMLPHTPHDPPSELLARKSALAPTEPLAKYWAMCELSDKRVGELLAAIEQYGRPDNTIVVYLSDNGWINLPDQSAFAPRSKRSPYDGGVRTPIMIHWQGRITPQLDTEHLASSIDLLPTLLALLDHPTHDLPGIDLTSHLATAARHEIFGEILEHDMRSMNNPADGLMYRWVIQDDYKLIVPDQDRLPDAPVELFNIVLDPNEQLNVAESEPKLAEHLLNTLDRWWAPKNASTPLNTLN